MAQRIQVRIVPMDASRKSFSAYYPGDQHDFQRALDKGGYVRFERGNGAPHWINIDNLQSIQPSEWDSDQDTQGEHVHFL